MPNIHNSVSHNQIEDNCLQQGTDTEAAFMLIIEANSVMTVLSQLVFRLRESAKVQPGQVIRSGGWHKKMA